MPCLAGWLHAASVRFIHSIQQTVFESLLCSSHRDEEDRARVVAGGSSAAELG